MRTSATNHPVVLALMLLKVIEATPRGGATQGQLASVYESVVGRYPSPRTIKRNIAKLCDGIDPTYKCINMKQGRYTIDKAEIVHAYMFTAREVC